MIDKKREKYYEIGELEDLEILSLFTSVPMTCIILFSKIIIMYNFGNFG